MDVTRDQLFSMDLQARIAVEIPELGGTLYIKRMSGAEGFAHSLASVDATLTNEDQNALLLVHTVCDSTGALLFTPEDLPAIMQLPYALLLPLVIQASNLNGLDVPVAELKKNSLVSRNGSNGTALLVPSA